jgi:hypothetical protein
MIPSEQRYGRCWGKTPLKQICKKTLLIKNATKFKIVCPLGILPKSRTSHWGTFGFCPPTLSDIQSFALMVEVVF